MKPLLYFHEHSDCKICKKTTNHGFKYIKNQKDEKYIFEVVEAFTIVFILSGEALITCNEFINIHFHQGEIVIWPINSNCSWQSLSETSAIVLTGGSEISPCDKFAIKEHADSWLSSVPQFKGLTIKPRLIEFLISVKNYIEDGITCPYMHKSKQYELSTIFRAYYSQAELIEFFIPIVRNTNEFKQFVMNNYLQMKGVKEFVDLSGMNLSTFNRKFKAHFNESPYQWLIKQKSKHIYYELMATDKSMATIARDYHFADASHFNRYCKSMFGDSPSKLREKSFDKKAEALDFG